MFLKYALPLAAVMVLSVETASAQVVPQGRAPDAAGRCWDPSSEVPPLTGRWELFVTGPGTFDFVINFWAVGNSSVCIARPFGLTPAGDALMLQYHQYRIVGANNLQPIGAGRMNLGLTPVAVPRIGTALVGNYTQTYDENMQPIQFPRTSRIAITSP